MHRVITTNKGGAMAWDRTKAAHVGDTVMTPTNVQATVTDATGSGPYDSVSVIEHTPERWTNTWRQNQLVVQVAAPWQTTLYRTGL